MTTRSTSNGSAALLALALATQPALTHAEAKYPDKPITYVVPNAPGGSGDVIARTLSEPLAHDLGVPIIVDNKAGATGVIGAQFVARSAADGYTLLVSSTGPMAVVPSLRHMPYDEAALLPVIEIAASHTVLVVSAKKPWRTVNDLVVAAKAAPGRLSFASGGIGTVLHLQGELLKMRTGTDMVHVPYKGDAPAVSDLLTGQVSMMFVPTQAVAPFVQSGQLRVIATTSAHRLKAFPDVPTMSESGVADFVSDAWFGAYVPAKTAPAVVARLNAAFNRALRDPTVAEHLQRLGLDIVGGEPATLEQAQRSDTARWAQVIKRANIHADE